MFEKVREPWRASRTKSILAYTIFGFICLTFVFVGFNPRQGGMGSGLAASVNDRVISVAELQERVSMIESQMGTQGQLPAAQRQMRAKMIRQNALEQLIDYELVSQSAQKVGITPTQAATRDLIVNIPAFQEKGRFTRELYDRYLTFKGTTAAEFEEKIKKDVIVGELRDLFTTSLETPKILTEYQARIRDTKINIEFVKIDSKALETLASDGSEAMKSFMADANNKAKIKGYYDSHKEEFSAKSEVRARHILIKGDNPETAKKIAEIRKETETGDFSALAKKYSEDEGSKVKGGELNFFARGQMVKEFEDAAFSLPIGKISEPIKTNYGYHIIKVEERRGGDTKTLENVSGEIARKLVLEDVREKKLGEIDTDLRAKKDVSPWLSNLKLKWQETGDFSLSQNFLPKVEAGASAVASALSLKNAGEIYPGLVRSGADSYIFRLKKITETKSPQATDKNPNSMMAGSESLGLWAEDLKKSAYILKNNVM